MNGPNEAAAPSVRLSVAGTEAPAPPSALTAVRISGATAVFQTVAPALSALTAQWMTLPMSSATGV